MAPGINATRRSLPRRIKFIGTHCISNDVVAKPEQRWEGVGELHNGDGGDEAGDCLDLGNGSANHERCVQDG